MITASKRNKDRMDELKREAVSRAEQLGHKIKRFDRYKDSEVYFSSFCAYCFAHLRVSASGHSGRAVEQPCQRFCDCGQPLTDEDLDGKCLRCRGNKLTLYPKTPAVRAKDAHFIDYCRK